MTIYKITNLITVKLYIGQTVQSMNDRWLDHKFNARNPDKYTSALYCSIRKHGVENFKIEQLDTAKTREQLNIMEQTYIKALNTLVPNGYNLELGGNNKQSHPETRAKISAALKGRPIKNRMNGAPKGRAVSTARRAKISATMTGKAQPWKYKAIVAIETGTVYKSINEAAKILKVNRVTISGLLKSGKRGRLGLTFKFVSLD